MSPQDRLRWAAAPVRGRAMAFLWGGLATMFAGMGVFSLGEVPVAASFVLYLVIVAGWLAAACGTIGYLRWFFRQTKEEMRDRR